MKRITARGLGLLFALLAIPLATAPAADTGADPQRLRFSVHDLDGDGFISLQEYRLLREKRQARLANRDEPGGQRLRYRLRAMRFVEIDSNGDGLISETEMLAALRQRFDSPCDRQQRRRRGQTP